MGVLVVEEGAPSSGAPAAIQARIVWASGLVAEITVPPPWLTWPVAFWTQSDWDGLAMSMRPLVVSVV